MQKIRYKDEDWGRLPSVDGTTASVTPPTVTSPSPTQVVQDANQTTLETVADKLLPPAPVQSYLINGNGLVTPAWNLWFTQLRKRIGGSIAQPADQAANLVEAFIDDRNNRNVERTHELIDSLQNDQPRMVVSQDQAILNAWDQADSERDIDRGRWDDLRMGSSIRLVGANDPTLSVFRGGLRAYAFADGASVKEVFLQGQLPHSYLEGSDIRLHIHWGHISGVNDGNVVWNVEWAWTNVGEAMGAPTTTAATAANVLGADQYKQQITPLVTMSGAGKKISSILTLRVFRDPATDTSTASAFMFEVDAHYQLDHAGSIAETSKR